MMRTQSPLRRSRTSCSLFALATVMVVGASPAAAQSFQGTGTPLVPGSATISTPDSITTNISVNSPQAVIDWQPFADGGATGTQIVFQPGGTTANFSGEGSYFVLNRINPADISRTIRMDGTITSTAGGNIYFYSPSGFVLGATSSINVGSLVLSASPLQVDGNGNFVNGTTATFNQAPRADSSIITMPGSQINALNQGSYVAMVAPRISHHGTITVNGSAALVGAEAATINFSPDGLFDITVTTGTTNGLGSEVAVHGDINGPSSTGGTDNHRVYLVAVPKNDAITLLVAGGSDLGFELAGSAEIDDNGAVVLSAGRDIAAGVIAGKSANSGSTADIQINDAHFTNNVFGAATGSAISFASAGSTLDFDSDVTIDAVAQNWMSAGGSGASLIVGGDLDLSTDVQATSEGGSAQGGDTRLFAHSGGSIHVFGSATLSANAVANSSTTTGLNAGTAVGGDVLLSSNSGALTIDQAVTLEANATGGNNFAGASAGIATGGDITVEVGNSASMQIGALTASADGQGGSSSNLGATGTGGTITIGSVLGSPNNAFIEVNGDTNLHADGYGGYGDGVGGFGDGGSIALESGVNTFSFNGGLTARADAQGGGSEGGDGGDALGGDVAVRSTGATIFVSNDLVLSANATGGGGENGGNATGGTVEVHSEGSFGVGDTLTASADGQGGSAWNGNGGDGTGGDVTLRADGGTLDLGGPIYAYAYGRGGGASGGGFTSGDGQGGDILIEALADGSIDNANSLNAHADGEGGYIGFNDFGPADGGDGTGGTVRIFASGNNANILIGNTSFISANGSAGYAIECRVCSGAGGNGTGGEVTIGGELGGTDNAIAFSGDLFISADGWGGTGSFGDAGNGQGGLAQIRRGEGGAFTLNGQLEMTADGHGGYHDNAGNAGDGTGGTAKIETFGTVLSVLDFNGGVELSAIGSGGDTGVSEGGGGAGGDGLGGFAGIYGSVGDIDIAGNFFADGTGAGGTALGGIGGSGVGREAGIFVTGGTVDIGGSAFIDASGTGGDGLTGGDGTGGGDRASLTEGAHIYAENAIVTIGGQVEVESSGTGGDGGTDFETGNGGNGGDGSGGWASIHAANSDLGPATINIQGGEATAYVITDGTGGRGGDGSGGFNGGNGGNGGTGTGGETIMTAAAGNGTLNIDNAILSSQGFGGAGGDAGGSDGGAGGNGGHGGAGFGGVINVGTESGTTQAALLNDGHGNYGSITADTTGWGGDGGTGGSFGDPAGNGGNGGAAQNGAAVLLVRGGTVDADQVTLVSQAIGGDGGDAGGEFGSDGNGGNATIGGDFGGVGVVATQRQGGGRGQLNVTGSISATATAEGGQGSIGGASNSLGGNLFVVDQVDADLGSVTFTIDANSVPPSAGSDMIAVIDGDVLVDGNFQFNTVNSLSLLIDNGSLTAGNFFLTAGDFVADVFNGPAGARGTVFANAIEIISGNNIIADANFDAVSDLSLIAAGLIDVGDLTSDGSIDAWAQGGSITAGTLNAGTSVDLLAATSITTGDIDAGTSVDIVAQSGGVDLGAIDAGGGVMIDAATSILVNTITAGGEISLDGADSVSTGDLQAGDFVLAVGGSILVGNVDANSIDLQSGSDITTGNLFAFGGVVLDANGFIDTGDITAGSIDLTATGDITTDDLTTQFLEVIQGDGITIFELFPGASITLNAGGDILTGNIASIDGVYANAGGSITTQAIDAFDFVELHAGTDIETDNITAGSYMWLDSGGNQSLGDLSAGLDIEFWAGGNVAFGDADAGTDVDFDVGGNVDGGNIVAGIEISGEGVGGNITLEDLTAGFSEGVDDDTFSIGLQAGGSITVGDVNGAQRVGFAALGDLTTGSITTGWDFMALIGGDITTGSITTASDGQVYMANVSMYLEATEGGELDFDPETVLDDDPVATGGSITVGGPVSTQLFRAAAGQGLTTQAITADTIVASAGGMATLNGLWDANWATLVSDDIAIGASGGTQIANRLWLQSTNSDGMLLGDGVSGGGYALSNSEFGRLSAGDIVIVAGGFEGAAADTLVGDLTITGPLAGSNIESADGGLAIVTLSESGEALDGTVRVVGDVGVTGFGSANYLEFHTEHFQLDAATGSIAITSTGTTLGGELGLYADTIHVAEGAILDQLADNPQFAGYQNALNEQAAVQRPEGVLNASVIWIESENLSSILIQNTGTSSNPAGFLANEIFVNDDFEVAGPPGSIDVVVNGQLQTEGGLITGVAVRDALVEGEDLTPFTATSTINGCPMVGACFLKPPPVPDVVDDQVDLISYDPLTDVLFGDEEGGGDGESGPIRAPNPLFDTRDLTDQGEVNDPVSGTGNPSLLDAAECDKEDETQCGTEKETKQ